MKSLKISTIKSVIDSISSGIFLSIAVCVSRLTAVCSCFTVRPIVNCPATPQLWHNEFSTSLYASSEINPAMKNAAAITLNALLSSSVEYYLSEWWDE